MFDWEEGLFRGVRGLFRAALAEAVPPHAAHLTPQHGELTALAQIIAGTPVRITAVKDEGGVRGSEILLPETLSIAPSRAENETLYRKRVVLAAALMKTQPEGDRVEAARTWLRHELGISFEPVSWGRFYEAAPEAAAAEEASLPRGREIDAPRVGDLSRVELDKKAQEDKVLIHSFEKIETADSFDGNQRKVDGADELDDQLEALEEVDLGALVRDGTRTEAILRADVGIESGIADADDREAKGIPYPEWDRSKGRYREAWCTVVPGVAHQAAPGWGGATASAHRATIDRLRKRLESQRMVRRTIGRQQDGEHPDVDALVDHLAAVKAGHSEDRLYLRSVPQRRDVATTVLLDLSLSADSWVDGRRILDVSRDAVLVLGEVTAALGDRLEVLCFSSATRHRCHVWSLKSFDEPWARARDRLGALEPQGYTRIGAPLRHATASLAATPADRRLLLVVSDLKPTDLDRYEGRYGMDDTRMALREADRMGVHVHALAVDRRARGTLPALVGPGRAHVVHAAEEIVPALTEVYGRVAG